MKVFLCTVPGNREKHVSAGRAISTPAPQEAVQPRGGPVWASYTGTLWVSQHLQWWPTALLRSGWMLQTSCGIQLFLWEQLEETVLFLVTALFLSISYLMDKTE